ncbi:hypothetical protein I6F35_33610 [Bradyrhizobium sp. BRP22]|uniref:hypothetical protein n=1 Tax=Bradyrhizobium sp. BRP22 TaxID=2793821 RepID=UPI001CD265D9|nr:hypothetical protein [Bradyrhizobium sp. BRP22]MCA1458073.1 hypothetical protein [Bradyrhizobium sp. BRP22]
MLALSKKPYDPSARPPSDRKPSGDKKAGIAPTVFYRLREHGARLGADPRLATVLGRMGLFKELSDGEVDAGFKIAEIYGRYESLKGMPRRSAASPSYERGFGSKDSLDTDRMLPDELKKHQRAVKRATKAFDRLQRLMPDDRLRDLIERVCCNNEEINPVLKPGLAQTLHSIAVSMGLIRETKATPKPKAKRDDGMLLVQAAVDALVQWFDERNSKPTHFSLVSNPDWKTSRGVTGSDGRYHHTIPVPLRGLTAEQMGAMLRLACAAAGMLEIADAGTGEVT